ncbi:hypothetical protein [Methanolapillus ohkumae]|uniref:Brix domain-containing protein n=1 Tax=Methanolapillus ohkumae TaxID=3028298 RepID=A0AA96ZVI5_9EURY|nr:hypothetical protein MsAm2_06660 [Methanosarcinaceae archaeon Am2]
MLFMTSSRKPSQKTKILCKKLALFFDAAYMNRGKTSFSDILESASGSVLLVVGEFHGNPGSLSFYDAGGKPFLSVYVSESYPEPISLGDLRFGRHVFCGTKDSAIFEALNRVLLDGAGDFIPSVSISDAKLDAKSEKEKPAKPAESKPLTGKEKNETFVRKLSVYDDRLDFSLNGNTFLRLYVKSVKTGAAAGGEQ